MNLNSLYEEDSDELTSEQKDAVYQSLAQKYAAAADRSDVEKAEKRARAGNLGVGLAEAFGNFGQNALRARGVNPASINLDGARASLAQGVARADAARKDRMNQVLAEDKLQWEGKERSRKEGEWSREDAARGREDDPNSMESKTAQALAKKLMPSQDFSGMSASQLKGALPSLEKIYTAEQQRLGRIDAINARNQDAQLRRDERADAKAEKAAEKEEALRVGDYGIARTPDDAKKLKDAVETKANFDRKLQEMIALRKSKGAEVWDRESVARGKQLSNDLKLLYKDLANLGVLSKSDEAIIDAVVPADPLEWNASSLAGQDPTMSRLQGLKGDVGKDFDTTLSNRLKGGTPKAKITADSLINDRSQFGGAGEAVAAPSDMVKIQAPDGSVRAVRKDQAEKYIKKGGKVIP